MMATNVATELDSFARSKWRIAAVAGVLVIAILTNAPGTWRIGLISDDFDILAQHATAKWGTFDAVHWSPLLRAMFMAISAEVITPQGAHILASLLHTCAAAACGALLYRTFKVPSWLAWACTMLWLVTPIATESVWWLCAQGYIWVSLTLVSALYVASEAPRSRALLAAQLALLQFVASLAWDWAVVLLPAVCILYLVRHAVCWQMPAGFKPPATNVRAVARSFVVLLPMAVVWFGHQLVRLHLQIPVGYGWMPLGPVRVIKDVLLAPAMVFAPNSAMWIRVTIALALWATLLRASLQDTRQRALLTIFLLLQMPYALQGVLQARYLYVSAPLLYVMLLAALYPRQQQGVRRAALALSCLSLFAYQVSAYMQNARAWRDASKAALDLASKLKEVIAEDERHVLLVDIPDAYGDPAIRWRPFMWRRGLQTQLPTYEQAFTAEFVQAQNIPGVTERISQAQLSKRDPSTLVLQIVAQHRDTEPADYQIVSHNH